MGKITKPEEVRKGDFVTFKLPWLGTHATAICSEVIKYPNGAITILVIVSEELDRIMRHALSMTSGPSRTWAISGTPFIYAERFIDGDVSEEL